MRPAPCIRGRADGEQCDGRESPCRREPESCQAQSTCTPPEALVATLSAPAEGLDKLGAGGEDIGAQLILTTIAGGSVCCAEVFIANLSRLSLACLRGHSPTTNAVNFHDRGSWDQRGRRSSTGTCVTPVG